MHTDPCSVSVVSCKRFFTRIPTLRHYRQIKTFVSKVLEVFDSSTLDQSKFNEFTFCYLNNSANCKLRSSISNFTNICKIKTKNQCQFCILRRTFLVYKLANLAHFSKNNSSDMLILLRKFWNPMLVYLAGKIGLVFYKGFNWYQEVHLYQKSLKTESATEKCSKENSLNERSNVIKYKSISRSLYQIDQGTATVHHYLKMFHNNFTNLPNYIYLNNLHPVLRNETNQVRLRKIIHLNAANDTRCFFRFLIQELILENATKQSIVPDDLAKNFVGYNGLTLNILRYYASVQNQKILYHFSHLEDLNSSYQVAPFTYSISLSMFYVHFLTVGNFENSDLAEKYFKSHVQFAQIVSKLSLQQQLIFYLIIIFKSSDNYWNQIKNLQSSPRNYKVIEELAGIFNRIQEKLSFYADIFNVKLIVEEFFSLRRLEESHPVLWNTLTGNQDRFGFEENPVWIWRAFNRSANFM